MVGGRGGIGSRTRSIEGTAGAVVGLLYESYGARIHGFCARRLGDRDEAADAVQDTFLRAWLALRNGAEVRHPLPWLLTIADNVCVSRFRARGARVTTIALSDHESADFSDAVGEVAGLAAALRELPVRQRQALLRRELQGLSYDEIGAELGVSRASVAALLHRARMAVADALREARRGVAALVPVPAVLRAPFEGGAAAGAAVAGTAFAGTAVIAIAQFAGAGAVPSSPTPPARTAEAISATLPSRHLALVTPRAGARVEAPLAAMRLGGAPAPPARSRVPLGDAVGVLGAMTFEQVEPTSADDPRQLPGASAAPDTSSPPEPEPTTPTAKTQTAAPPAAEDEAAASPAPRDRPQRAEIHAPPGKQPRGTQGRSQHAPGQVEKPERADGPAGAPQSSSEPDDKGQKAREGTPAAPGAGPAEPPVGKADEHVARVNGQDSGGETEKAGRAQDGKASESKAGSQGKGLPPDKEP